LKQTMTTISKLRSLIKFFDIHPLPDLPPGGKERPSFSPLGETGKGVDGDRVSQLHSIRLNKVKQTYVLILNRYDSRDNT
jgi:hypothetical protein